MNELELSVILMLLLFAVLGSGVWIAIALAVCGFAALLTKVATPAGQVLATSMWAASNSWDLTALPMFIWGKFSTVPNCPTTCSKDWRPGCRSCQAGCCM